jgi:penicillin-binding protein 1B
MTGAQSALPAWVDFMVSTAPDDAQDFAIPSGIEMATIDPASGGLATPACPRTVRLPFLIGSAPTRQCTLHGGVFASLPPSNPPEGSVTPAMPSAEPASAPSATHSDIFGKIGSFFGSLFKP